MLISQVFSPVALRNGGNIAFRYLKHRITYKEFWETSSRFSYFLQKEIGHGRRVGLWMSNTPHVAYCFFALANTKSCTVPLNPWASPEENLFKIKNAGITVILCTNDHVKVLTEMLHQNGLGSIRVIDMEGKRCAEYDPSYTPPANHQPSDKDQILLFYTPGTSGKYKGCLFNHNSVGGMVTALKGAYKTMPTDVFYSQFHHSNPFNFMHFLLAPLASAAGVYISDQVDAKEILPMLTEHRVSRMAPQANLLPELLRVSVEEKIPIPTVKQFVINGKAFTPETVEMIKKVTKAGVVQNYGMTEYLGTFALSTPELAAAVDPKKPGLIGPPLVGTKIRVVDDNNDEIDKKKPQKGQLLVMGPGLMDKYLDLPEDQKMTVRGTWLFTGDLVEIDKDGNITFLDRKADVVTLQDGAKVFAKEVEPFVYQIPQVQEAAFVGVRDRLKKPVPAIVIVKKEKQQLNEKQVMDFLATKLAMQKRPTSVFFIDAMPRTISGVINRAKLRSQFDGV